MSGSKWNAREKAQAEASVSNHDPSCTWPLGQPCRKFSTDGTHLGAEIAHTMGTTSEALIAAGMAPNGDGPRPFVSDVDEEQAEWEACDICSGYGCPECTGEPGPPVDHERPRAYPARNCDWN